MKNDSIKVFKKTVIMVNEYIAVKPLCDFFGISYKRAAERIRNDEILKNEWTKMSSETLFGDNRERFCVTKKGFVRWIQLINAGIIGHELRSKFIEFQSNVFDYLYEGNVIKNQQLQDILQFNKEATRLKSLYGRVGNAIKRRNFGLRACVQSTPEEWADKREKYFPEQKAIN